MRHRLAPPVIYRRALLVVFAALVLRAPLLRAHHSAAEFDFGKWVTVEGTVKRFEVVNPHAEIVLTITDDKGTRDITFEGHSRNNFYRAGWRPDSVKFGDRIKLSYAARKDGRDGGYVNSFVTAQGQEIGFKLPTAGGAASSGKGANP